MHTHTQDVYTHIHTHTQKHTLNSSTNPWKMPYISMFRTLAMEKGEVYSNCFRERNQPFHSTECEKMRHWVCPVSLSLLSPSLTRSHTPSRGLFPAGWGGRGRHKSARAQSMQVRWRFHHRWVSPNQQKTLHTERKSKCMPHGIRLLEGK